MNHCPCGREALYINCCGRFIEGNSLPTTPEELMRSRYTAYTQANIPYIARTMKSPAADHFEKEEAQKWANAVEWLKLEVLTSGSDGPIGYVEFMAHFLQQGKRHFIHEYSKFRLEENKWYYVEGYTPTHSKPSIATRRIGRNENCPCASGKKYKRCCGSPK